MKKQLTAIMSLFVIGAFITSGSYAYFSSTTVSSNNPFSTGSAPVLELQSDEYPTWTSGDVVLMTVSGLLPGVETGARYLYYMNAGAIDATVTINLAVDNGGVASKIWITQASLDGTPTIESYWAYQIAVNTGDHTWDTAVANGYVAYYPTATPYPYVPTLYGMTTQTFHFTETYGGPDIIWHPGNSHYSTLHFMLDPTVGNDYADQTVLVTFTGTITQAA